MQQLGTERRAGLLEGRAPSSAEFHRVLGSSQIQPLDFAACVHCLQGALLVGLLFFPFDALAFERHPHVAALPEFARIDDIGPTVVILRGELTRKRARRMERKARLVYRDVARRFIEVQDGQTSRRRGTGADTKSTRKRPPVDLCLFESSASYITFIEAVFGAGEHSQLGFYMPSHRLVVANLGRSVGNLRHELAHPLVGDDFPGIPAWVNEGIGSLYGTVRERRDRIDFVVNYRLRHLREARRNKTLPNLEELARSRDRDVYGHRAMTYYAMGRYLLLYLDRKGQLTPFYRALRKAPDTQLELLKKYVDEKAFLRFCDGLRYPSRS